MIDLRRTRLRVLILAMASIAIFAIAACGSSDDGGSDPTATTQSSGQPGATNTPTFGFGNIGDLGDVFDNACSSIELAASLPDGLVDGSASDEPTSDTARDIANFFSSAISDAIGDNTPACYVEFSDDGDFGMWVGFDLDEDAPANAAELLKDQLIDRGVDENDIESSSFAFGAAGFNNVSATNVDILGQYSDGEVNLFISGDTVVLAVEHDSSSNSPISTSTPFPGAATSTPGNSTSPTSTPAPTVQTSGQSAEVDNVLKPLLEDALGVDLNLTSNFNSSGQGGTSVILTYEMSSESTVNLLSKLTAVVESLNGTVLFSGSFGGSTSVSFEGVLIDGDEFSGAFAVFDGTVNFTGQSAG